MNKKYKNNIEYTNIINNIINNDEFQKISDCSHHGITRLEHSLRVSYFSYKTSKFLHLNARETARAGLLHDFFVTENMSEKEKIVSCFKHPKKALKNADDIFILSDMERDIIYSHMFPLIITRPPKYLESWLVSVVDKIVAIYEFSSSYSKILLCKSQYLSLIAMLLLERGL